MLTWATSHVLEDARQVALAQLAGPDECLNEHWFLSLAEARHLVEAWRSDCGPTRPHSSLGNLTPEGFKEACLDSGRAVGPGWTLTMNGPNNGGRPPQPLVRRHVPKILHKSVL